MTCQTVYFVSAVHLSPNANELGRSGCYIESSVVKSPVLDFLRAELVEENTRTQYPDGPLKLRGKLNSGCTVYTRYPGRIQQSHSRARFHPESSRDLSLYIPQFRKSHERE